MKKIISAVLILTLLFCAAVPSYAQKSGKTYYVDAVSGDDGNSGLSESSAWKTLSAASAHVYSAGDKVLLKAGSFFDGTFTAFGDGTAENPILLGSYGDIAVQGKPVIRSSDDVILVTLSNVSGWTVENLEFTAPNGKGMYILATDGTESTDITVKDCTFRDIWYKQCKFYMGAYCPLMLASYGAASKLRRITVTGCSIYDCAYGIITDGLNRAWTPDTFVSPEESYNTDYLFENISLNNVLYDGIVISSVNGMTVRNCSLIDVSLNDDYCTAPMYSHFACNFLIENCEIAGATNENDGMALDFDGWVTNGTYQYIYSHDNYRFIRNCCYDNYTKNANCTVRYCLSVNDNKGDNDLAQLMFVDGYNFADDEWAVSMDNFRFYNNTLVNCSEIKCSGLSNSVVANNIFVGKSTLSSIQHMRKGVDKKGTYVSKFDGLFTNNCFWNMGVASACKNNFICNPKFVGTDEADKNSFVLSDESKLIGSGIIVEENMGEHDFFGNPLTDAHNIGCYEGAGEKMQGKAGFFSAVGHFLGFLLATVIGFFVNCNNTYWLF